MHEGLDTGKELGGIVTLGFYLRGGLLPTLNTVGLLYRATAAICAMRARLLADESESCFSVERRR